MYENRQRVLVDSIILYMTPHKPVYVSNVKIAQKTSLWMKMIVFIHIHTHQSNRIQYIHHMITSPAHGIFHHRLYYTVVSHSHIMSHHVEMAYLNTCVKSYSILFTWSSASIFSNRVPNWRPESLDVFSILFDSVKLTLSCRGGFEETRVGQKCSHISIYCRRKQPITRSCILVR